MPRGQRRSNVRRANVTACTRCRSRKQRCDQGIPACSNCERVGAECLSADIDGGIVPRSYVKSLEDRIAFLETQPPAPHFPVSVEANVDPSSRLSHDNVEEPADLVGQIASDSLWRQPFFARNKNHDGFSLLQSLLSGPVSRLPLNERSDSHALLDEMPSETTPAIPGRDVAEKLLDIYFEHCDFFSPILSSRENFLEMIEPLYSNPTPDQPLANVHFRALIVFATSILLLNRVDSTVPSSKSETFFNAAIRVFSQYPEMICTGDQNQLENLLFIIQYCCFSANITAVWHFLGLATRLAVELNLHKESPSQTSLSQSQLNERRWLFWTMYTFERNLCVIVGRPFSIPDGAIETPLPVLDFEDPQRALAIHLIKYRLLESEIYSTLNEKKYPGAIFHKGMWRETVHRNLQEWHSSIPLIQKSTHLAPSEIFNGSLFNALVLLYYPSPHFPSPSAEDISILARSATDAIDCYKQCFRSGELRFFWRTVHNVFRSGVAIVYCVQRDRMNQNAILNLEDARASVNSCTSLLWGMVERYPPGRAYRDIFDKLANTVLSQRENLGHGDGISISTDPAETGSVFHDLSLGYDTGLLSSSAFDTLIWGFTDQL
ncbi:fungal-specific transcription factor domain-containing protein [Penicillium angulare]|uniref:Fungal-specific transcription factor domain-containing protein n=1 Tax=Penicillium angulare TaxID=116970 RepID=A0A9W9F4L5_9EURO|nr:fungal-specific transcription factor domain-containing protein [Penicillium angulare]